MARFRLFGRPAAAVADAPAPLPAFAQLPGSWGAAHLPPSAAGPATAASRPISWLTGEPPAPAAPTPVGTVPVESGPAGSAPAGSAPAGSGPAEPIPVEPMPVAAEPAATATSAAATATAPHAPVSDPVGSAPIPPLAATGGGSWPAPAPHPGPTRPAPAHDLRPAGPAPAPDAADASALAGAYAADYLSWDEDDPDRRGRVLAEYLAHPLADPARLGWSGRGRQRSEFALPGRVRPDGDGRVLVDVRVRVTPYRVVGEHGDDGITDDSTATSGVPAAAPAPTARGWRSLPSHWVRLSVPVLQEGGRLVVDVAEETLGEEALGEEADPARRRDGLDETRVMGLGPVEHSLVDDDLPAAEPWVGAGW